MFLPSQSLTCSWGSISDLRITSLQFSGEMTGEIDVTGMDATVLPDPQNTNRRVVRKSVDYAVLDYGSVTVDFFAKPSGLFSLQDTSDYIGRKNVLTITRPAEQGVPSISYSHNAFLTSFSFQAATGELVRGTCTFKLSDK